jgi:hypothetical protein
MKVTWKRMYQGSFHGLDDGGRTVAQIGYVIGPAGTPLGWSAHLVDLEGELFDYYPTQQEAQAAAELALDDS